MAADGNGEWVEWVMRVPLLCSYDVFTNLQFGELSVHIQDGRRANVLTIKQKAKFDAFLWSIHLHFDG